MNVSDEFFLGIKRSMSHAESVGVSGPKVVDVNVDDLVRQLEEKGITVDLEDSVVHYSYKRCELDYDAEAPMDGVTLDPTKVTIKGYTLAGDLNIVLMDIDKVSTPPALRGRRGGSASYKRGIECKLDYKGEGEDGAQVIKNARELLQELYK